MIRRIRLGFVVIICVVLQTTLFTHLRVDGVAPEVGLVAVLAVAYYDGAESGAFFGFVMGFAVDLFLTTPLGLSALSYAITAYVVGLVQAEMVRRPPFVAPLIGGLGGFLGGLVFLAVGAVVGEVGFLSLSSLKTVTIAALLDALIAPIVFPLVRRAARRPRDPAWRVAP